MIHAVDLRHGLVALVDEHQVVARQIIEQRRRRFARQTPRKVPGIVLNSMAVADLLHHLQIEHRPLPEPLCLDQLALPDQFRMPQFQFLADRSHCCFFGARGHDVVRLGVDRQALISLLDLAQQRIDLRQAFHLVAPEFDPVSKVVVGGEEFDYIAAHPERATPEVAVIAFVENIHQFGYDLLARYLLALLQHQQHAIVSLRRTQPVDAANARHDDAVPAFEQRLGSGEPEFVEFVVDRRFFFDVDIARRNVGFGLIVVVVTDEILHRIRWEEVLELAIELGGKRLVMRHH